MMKTNRRLFCATIAATAALTALPNALRAEAKTTAKSAVKASTVVTKPVYPSIIGSVQTHTTVYEDSLVDLARKHGLGYTEIVSANPGLDPWVPGADKKVVLPKAHILPAAPREGIVINLADQRLYFFREDGKTVDSVPLGIGNNGWDTPKGHDQGSPQKEEPDLVRAAVCAQGRPRTAGNRPARTGQPAWISRGLSWMARIPVPWNEQAIRCRPAGKPWMRATLSGRYRPAFRRHKESARWSQSSTSR